MTAENGLPKERTTRMLLEPIEARLAAVEAILTRTEPVIERVNEFMLTHKVHFSGLEKQVAAHEQELAVLRIEMQERLQAQREDMMAQFAERKGDWKWFAATAVSFLSAIIATYVAVKGG
jgi:hypothetical protein